MAAPRRKKRASTAEGVGAGIGVLVGMSVYEGIAPAFAASGVLWAIGAVVFGVGGGSLAIKIARRLEQRRVHGG